MSVAPGAYEPAFWAVIPAAGIGSRFGESVLPKQYAPLGSMTVLERSAVALLRQENLRQLVIAVHPDDVHAKKLSGLQDARIRFVAGGAERADSVRCALQSLVGQASDDDWVLVHDAARPCLDLRDVQKMLATLANDPVGGILAVPAIDTLKQVEGDVIRQTVDRRAIWQAQTPQMFRFGLLLHCLQSACDDRRSVTDEASAVEMAGYAVKVVEGRRSNIKITYPEDLALAAFYLQQEEP